MKLTNELIGRLEGAVRHPSAREQKWFRELVDALLPDNASRDLPAGASQLDVETYVDDLLSFMPIPVVAFVRLNNALAHFGPPLFLRRWCTFERLAEDEKAELLTRMSHHKVYLLRQGMTLLKAMMTMGLLQQEEVTRHFHYSVHDDGKGMTPEVGADGRKP